MSLAAGHRIQRAVVGGDESVKRCLPARLDLATLDESARERGAADLQQAQRGLAEQFGFASWVALHAEVERPAILNAPRRRDRSDEDRR